MTPAPPPDLLPYGRLRAYQQRVAAMLADPECTGDLLSLGVALLDFAVLRTTREERSWRYYAERAWGDVSGWRIEGVLRGDVRRYDGARDADRGAPARLCGAPMVRRQGPCGRSASQVTMLTDPDTGRTQWLAACTRHDDWFADRVRRNRLAVESAGVVMRPPANAGGVLARHLPEIDWADTWRKIVPGWTPPPEAEPEVVPLRPRLRLVWGGTDSTADP